MREGGGADSGALQRRSSMLALSRRRMDTRALLLDDEAGFLSRRFDA